MLRKGGGPVNVKLGDRTEQLRYSAAPTEGVTKFKVETRENRAFLMILKITV
jgi:hypothetical protein